MRCVGLQQMKQVLIKMSGKNFVNTSFHFFCKVLTDVLAYLLQFPSQTTVMPLLKMIPISRSFVSLLTKVLFPMMATSFPSIKSWIKL
jgi:hypothetical protein